MAIMNESRIMWGAKNVFGHNPIGQLLEKDYADESRAVSCARLLDIVACTTRFAKPKGRRQSLGRRKVKSSRARRCRMESCGLRRRRRRRRYLGVMIWRRFTRFRSCRISTSSLFSHVCTHIHLKRVESKDGKTRRDGDYFEMQIKICNGKIIQVMASVKGFYTVGNNFCRAILCWIFCNSKVELLPIKIKVILEGEMSYYDGLFSCNLPYGFRANTWLAPSSIVDSASNFVPLPIEDENWGGNGGGQGRLGEYDRRPWATDFAILASLPCKTEEERVVRDRKAFLVHNLFLDVSTFKAVSSIQKVINSAAKATSNFLPGSVVHESRIGDLSITVKRDDADASLKRELKIIGSKTFDELQGSFQRNLLKE
ncbi:protein TSS [Sesamum angolense]|uniref:Protein TSS n=1 Tax=Sesamum angolense TaxID=2727404 RepID=A0AAE2BRX0_9LAMI|nr:protein TSS [Sesamum angolense]